MSSVIEIFKNYNKEKERERQYYRQGFPKYYPFEILSSADTREL